MTRWVRTAGELEGFVGELQGSAAIALDSESDSLHHHRAKVCLVQVGAGPGKEALVDPLAVQDMSALGPILADPAVVKILHGADYDVTTLKRDFGFRFASLFDTMIAARFLGLPEVGLQAVARAELGVELSKDSQKDDWSRRPLTPVQEAYALADVQHLIPLHTQLGEKLAAAGRLSWVAEECAAVAALEPARKGSDPEAWQKVKGVRRLTRRQLSTFRALHAWREDLAAATDIPSYKLLSNETLFTLAEEKPGGLIDLGRVRGLSPRIRQKGADILRLLRESWERPESDLDVLPTTPRPVVSDATRARVDALRAWRTAEAVRLKIDVSVVLPQRLLDRVAESAPATLGELALVGGLRQWRVETFGVAMLEATRNAGRAPAAGRASS
jgi:ribonuclease D